MRGAVVAWVAGSAAEVIILPVWQGGFGEGTLCPVLSSLVDGALNIYQVGNDAFSMRHLVYIDAGYQRR